MTDSETHDELFPSVTSDPAYQLCHTLTAHTRSITALKFSPDDSLLVSAGADGWLHFWEPMTGEHLRGFLAHKAGVNDISISLDSLYVATASDDSTSVVYLLNPPQGVAYQPPTLLQVPATYPGEQQESKPQAATEPASPSTHGFSHPAIRRFVGHTAPILSVAFSPKSNLLATSSFDESAIIWDVRRNSELWRIPAHADAIWCVAWDTDGEMILTASADGLIRLWDANSGQCLKTIDNDSNSPVSHAAFTRPSSFLYSSTLSSKLRIYNIHSGKAIRTFRAPGMFSSERWACPVIIVEAPSSFMESNESPHQQHSSEEIYLEKDNKEKESKTKSNPAYPKRSFVREARIIAGSENGKIMIWNIQSKQVTQILEGKDSHTTPVTALAVSSDARIVASGSLEMSAVIKIWKSGS
ncbi:uncharacterized protein L203_103889 [Cryptococcus depauperatus CBS 7841]|uniref:Uncharacterized protein n=1 Tax=Cryptococcus depauperatus CBS 7841 TaxID=1295531 RepID=A0A1E3HJB4_9TREE|nr:hypothetical protein L203_06390 [Cryptococcus depauperatus CBS 7841]